MYNSQRQRCQDILQTVKSLCKAMALDPRAFPGIASELRPLKSSASTPSLRSRNSEFVEMLPTAPETGAGNVRVVVRVRGFLPRGQSDQLSPDPNELTLRKSFKEAPNASYKWIHALKLPPS